MLDYHERAGERLEEMKRELPAEGGKTELSVERRMATHAKTREPPDPNRVARWRTQMSAEDRAEFEETAGELLAELGYPVGAGAVEEMEAKLEAVGSREGPDSDPEDGASEDSVIGSAYRAPERPSIPKRALLAGGDAVQRLRTHAQPRYRRAAGAVHRLRHPLGLHADAADARLPSRDGDPARDPLRPRPDQGPPLGARRRRPPRRGRSPRTAAGATSTWTPTS